MRENHVFEEHKNIILADFRLTGEPGERWEKGKDAYSLEERLLRWLLKHPLQREGDLAFALNLHRATISRHLAALQKQGWVASISSSLDPKRWYYLTPTGRQHLAKMVG